MSREIPYDENAECDICGHIGAFDFQGDYFCEGCIITHEEEEVVEE